MAFRMVFTAVCLGWALAFDDVTQDGFEEMAVSSEGYAPEVRQGKGLKHGKGLKRKRHHKKEASLPETSARTNCVAWKDATFEGNSDNGLYQFKDDFADKDEADTFFADKKNANSEFAMFQFSGGVETDKYGSVWDHDKHDMALVCGISLNQATPFVAKASCGSDELIDKMADCQIAGPFLGKKYMGSVSTDDDNTPPGCHIVSGNSYFNMLTTVSASGGTSICRVPTSNESPSGSLASSEGEAPEVAHNSIVRRHGKGMKHGKGHQKREEVSKPMETEDQRMQLPPSYQEAKPTETTDERMQLPPSFLGARGASSLPLPKSMQSDSGLPLPKSMQSEPNLRGLSGPPMSPRRAERRPRRAEPVSEEKTEADRAAESLKVLQQLQELKMQMELKKMRAQLEKEHNDKAETTASTSAALKVETTATTTAASLKPASTASGGDGGQVQVLEQLQALKMQMEIKQMKAEFEKKHEAKVETTATTTVAQAIEWAKVATTTAAALQKVPTTIAQVLKVETTASTTAAALQAVSTNAAQAPKLQTKKTCADSNEFCADWATHGECEKNPGYMNIVCQMACKQC